MLPILTLCCSALIVLSFSPLFVELTLLIVLIDECESLLIDRLFIHIKYYIILAISKAKQLSNPAKSPNFSG